MQYMLASQEIWIDPAPEIPEEGWATLELLEGALTPYGQERLVNELREAKDLDAIKSVEIAWLRTFISRSNPAYRRGRAWAKRPASNKGMSLAAIKLKLGL